MKHTFKSMRTHVATLVTFSSLAGGANAAVSLTGVELLSSPQATVDPTRTTTTTGSSLILNSGSNDPQGGAMILVDDTFEPTIDSGYTITFDVTRINDDTDFGFGITDGVNFFGILAFDTSSAPALARGSFSGIDSVATIDFGVLLTNTGVPSVGSSGTIILDYNFGAATTTLSVSGSYFSGLGGNNSSFTTYTFGSPVTIGVIDGGASNESYQINSISSVPEPSSALLLGLGALGIVARRRRTC